MTLTPLILAAALTITAPAIANPNPDYLIISLVPPDDDYHRAAETLAKRHKADILTTNADGLAALLPQLQQRSPATVAFVIRPETLDLNLARTILDLATRIDDDPFADFAYGVITGRDADAALKLVEASAKPAHTKPAITMLGIGGPQIGRSQTQPAVWPLRRGRVPITSHTSIGETDETRDEAFLAKAIPQLAAAPILLLASHGYPDGLVGGPKAADIRGLDLSGAVALNIACYTGVTGAWFEDDHTTMTTRRRNAAADDSFCLQMIDNGVASYIAYLSPRPAGPTMMGDAMLIAAGGPVGQLHRDNTNSIILAHLLAGSDRIDTTPARDNTPLPAQRTPASIVLTMSTGGVLFGDPAFAPFPHQPDSDPRTSTVTQSADRITVETTVTTPLYHFYAAEPINYWDDHAAAMRIETTVPLGDRAVRAINILEPPAQAEHYRYAAAIEHDRGERHLRIKIVISTPSTPATLRRIARRGLSATVEILTEASATPPDDTTIWRGGK